jgi:hypothetical protein
LAGPRVSVSGQNKKIIVACPPNPTANKGDAGSLTIVANDTSPRVSVNSQTVHGLLKVFTYIDFSAHGIQISPKSRQGHTSNFLKHSYARSFSKDIHNTGTLPTVAATLPARLRRYLPAADMLFSIPTAPYVTTVMRMRLLACGQLPGQPKGD